MHDDVCYSILMNQKLIVMAGLPGTGKSTLAESIAKAKNIPLFSVDPIESAILKAGIEKSFETGVAAYLVASAIASEQIKLGSSVIIDAVNAEEEAKDVWRDLAKKHEVQLLVIETFLSDESRHQTRLEARVRNLHGIPEVTWDKVDARKKIYTPWKEPTLRLDSVDSTEYNSRKAIEYIETV